MVSAVSQITAFLLTVLLKILNQWFFYQRLLLAFSKVINWHALNELITEEVFENVVQSFGSYISFTGIRSCSITNKWHLLILIYYLKSQTNFPLVCQQTLQRQELYAQYNYGQGIIPRHDVLLVFLNTYTLHIT